MSGFAVLVLLLFPIGVTSDVVCGNMVCSNLQKCCDDQVSCCVGSSTTSLGAAVAVIFVVCATATGLGICLYFKKRVHRDTSYTPEDIEGMFVTSLYKEMKSKVQPMPSDNTMMSRDTNMTPRDAMVTPRAGTPGMICEDVPMIRPGSAHTELAVMPSTVSSSYSMPGSGMTTPNNIMMTSQNHMMMASRQSSMGTLNSVERVAMMDKMTESVETQVTSAKRTVVTVNLNMKEKENIKLNIFMNKDSAEAVEEEVESNASFPRGLTAKVARKKSARAKQSSSSSVDQKAAASNKSLDRKASVTKKDSVKRTNSKSPARGKPPIKEKLSGRGSVAKKKKL